MQILASPINPLAMVSKGGENSNESTKLLGSWQPVQYLGLTSTSWPKCRLHSFARIRDRWIGNILVPRLLEFWVFNLSLVVTPVTHQALQSSQCVGSHQLLVLEFLQNLLVPEIVRQACMGIATDYCPSLWSSICLNSINGSFSMEDVVCVKSSDALVISPHVKSSWSDFLNIVPVTASPLSMCVSEAHPP